MYRMVEILLFWCEGTLHFVWVKKNTCQHFTLDRLNNNKKRERKKKRTGCCWFFRVTPGVRCLRLLTEGNVSDDGSRCHFSGHGQVIIKWSRVFLPSSGQSAHSQRTWLFIPSLCHFSSSPNDTSHCQSATFCSWSVPSKYCVSKYLWCFDDDL